MRSVIVLARIFVSFRLNLRRLFVCISVIIGVILPSKIITFILLMLTLVVIIVTLYAVINLDTSWL